MTSKSRIYCIVAIGLLAVLSVAVVLTAVAATHSDILERFTNSGGGLCHITDIKLREALAKICDIANSRLMLNVKFGDSVISCGAELTPENTNAAPAVKMSNAEADARYTLLMLDPDAPGHSLNTLKFWLHWAVTDIKGLSLQQGLVEGKELIGYAGPTPPKGTGVHRYQIVVFESTENPDVTLVSNKRGQFGLEKFVERNQLCDIVGMFEFVVPAQE